VLKYLAKTTENELSRGQMSIATPAHQESISRDANRNINIVLDANPRSFETPIESALTHLNIE
jgi:hypothetical protein